ncbi:MAG: glycosyltransferase [Pirellulales bacterium]
MICYTVLLAQRNAATQVGRLLAELCTVMSTLGKPYEVICLDDGSPREARQALRGLLAGYPALRVLCLDPAGGPAAALGAGIAAARGEVVVALEASGRYPVQEIPRLVARLNRSDAVFGYRRASGPMRFCRRLLYHPRRLFRGPDIHDPGCLLWAARLEAVRGLTLFGRRHFALAALVARRGYRVGELHVHYQPTKGRPVWPHWTGPAGLVSHWLPLGRRPVCRVTQLMGPAADGGRKTTRIDPAQPLDRREAQAPEIPRSDQRNSTA